MRKGQNPAKSVKTVVQPQQITVAVVNYIPTMGGYFSESLDVMKACLNSIWENTRLPYDLMVFDNASCRPVREYLQAAHENGRIQYLVLSERNYGKAGAWNFLFGAAPGKYIAYADSDVYHHPGWLAPQIEILERFPKTGMVTGMPMWTPEEFSSATVAWASMNTDVSLSRGKHLPWEDYWKHSRSLGAEETGAREHYDTIENLVVTHEWGRLYIGAAHFQFVAPKAVLANLLPIPSKRPMGQVRLLDIALNEAGYLRFCTPDWWIEHMGNRLEVRFQPDDKESGLKIGSSSSYGFWERKLPRRVVRWLYHKTFEIVYKD